MADEQAAWEQILKIRNALPRMDYYYMLGLPREAIAAQIETRAAEAIH